MENKLKNIQEHNGDEIFEFFIKMNNGRTFWTKYEDFDKAYLHIDKTMGSMSFVETPQIILFKDGKEFVRYNYWDVEGVKWNIFNQ